jgi:hypothetical protein
MHSMWRCLAGFRAETAKSTWRLAQALPKLLVWTHGGCSSGFIYHWFHLQSLLLLDMSKCARVAWSGLVWVRLWQATMNLQQLPSASSRLSSRGSAVKLCEREGLMGFSETAVLNEEIITGR